MIRKYIEKDTRVFNFGSLDSVMEGLHRPGHFNGVAQVVSRLFNITKPDIVYFGIKDFQQVELLRNLCVSQEQPQNSRLPDYQRKRRAGNEQQEPA